MATIKDVAKKANLSVSTVSRYLNNHPYISEDKRERIKHAMAELNYTPSSVATQLRSKKGTMLGILVSRIANPFFAHLVDSIEQQAKIQGYHVLIMQTYDDKKAELKMLDMLKQQVISGLMMCSVEGNIELIEAYREFGPIVLCNEQFSDAAIPQVITNQEKATFDAVNYLVNQGYQKIAYCTGGSLMKGGHGNARTAGFERALLTHALTIKKSWIFKETHTIEDGYLVAEKILNLPEAERPDAIFTGGDEVASGILEKMLMSGKKVPEDLAIMGFDNQPSTAILSVPLTTIAQPIEALGQESVKLLIAILEDQQYVIDYSKLKLVLIKRESA